MICPCALCVEKTDLVAGLSISSMMVEEDGNAEYHAIDMPTPCEVR